MVLNTKSTKKLPKKFSVLKT